MADFELEKILSFHSLTLGYSEETKKSKAVAFDIDYNEFTQRIKGKEKELEFLLLLRTFGVLKHLESFDESTSHITQEFTSDYKIEYLDGYKCLLEIKHTDKEIYKISKGNLNNRIEFAKRHEMPLRFAISIKGIWGMYTTEQLIQNDGKISLSNDYLNSWLEPELDTCSYGFFGKIRIESIYSKNYQKGMGISLKPYGDLVSQKLYHNNKLIYKAKGYNSKYIKHVILLGALQDRLSFNQTKKTDGNFTIITEETGDEPANFIPEYEFILSYIRKLNPILGVNKKDNISAAALKKELNHPYVSSFRSIVYDLSKLGLLIMCSRQGKIFSIDDFIKKIWKYQVT